MEENKPQKIRNRGKSSEDDVLFGNPKEQEKLKEALSDVCYLLSRNYPVKSSIALAGNRWKLRTRQLLALQGMACSDADVSIRAQKEIPVQNMLSQTLYIDGFNILIILETLLSGGYVFKGADGCYRDVSSVHGTYKKVQQTEQVLTLAGEAIKELGIQNAIWVFDTPVSNSGKLKTLCYEIATEHNFAWDIILDNAPDKFLAAENRLVSSSDAWILNECHNWFNLTAYIIEKLQMQGRIFNIITP